MHRQVVKATILCLVATTLCGCSSGFRWPWSKKPADADLSAVDPGLAVAAPAVGAAQASQVTQNTQLPSGYSGPSAGANSYQSAVTQRNGYGGGFADTSAPARPGYGPQSGPVGYDTASTYNPPRSGAVYPPPAYQPAMTGPPQSQDSAPPVAYNNSPDGLAPSENLFGQSRTAPAAAQPAAQNYPPVSNYASAPPPGGAYPQANAPYTAPTNGPTYGAPPPMGDPNNPYRGPRYTLTSSRPPSPAPANAAAPQDVGAAQYGSAPAQNGRYPAVDPFGVSAAPATDVAQAPQSYGPPTQQYAAPAPYAAVPPATAPMDPPPNVAAPAPQFAADPRYDVPRYNPQPAVNAPIAPIAVDTQPPVPTPLVENHYATGDPLSVNQVPASAGTPPAAIPAAQPMRTVSQPVQPEVVYDPPAPPRAAAAVNVPVESPEPPPAAVAVPPLPATPLVGVPPRSSIRKLGKPGEPVKPKRAPETKTAMGQRPRTRPDLTESESPAPAKVRDPDDASSRFRNPLRDSD